MKALINATLLVTLLAGASVAQADWSANVGFQSDYYFRGIFQKNGSAQGGIDYEHESGFYVGTWAADVGGDIAGDGLEIDVYGGWGGSSGDISYGIGFTGYYYTGDFDDTYQEVNLSFGYKWLTIDAAIGEYDASPTTFDYQFYSATVEHNGFWAQYGTFQDEFSGDYLQLGYDFSVVELDFGISLLLTDDNAVGVEEEALIFSIGKTFDL